MNSKKMNYLKILLPLIVGLLSFFIVAQYASSPEFHKKTIESLDGKKTTVTALTTAATATSLLISALPDDTASPVADQLADLSSCLLVVLSAIYLEKYLLTIFGYVTFKVIIPAACVLLIFNVWLRSETIRIIVRKAVLIGLMLSFVIPLSEQVSLLINKTYESSIEEVLDFAMETEDIVEDETTDEEESWTAKLGNTVSGFVNGITDGVTDILDRAKTSLNNLIEAIAVMIVTTCLIPVLVLMFMLWAVKFILGININIPPAGEFMILKKGIHKFKKNREKTSVNGVLEVKKDTEIRPE